MELANNIVIIGIVVMVIVGVLAVMKSTSDLRDESNTTVVEVDDLLRNVLLTGDDFRVSYFRQSGNEYKATEKLCGRDKALRKVISTFKSAKINEVRVYANTNNKLIVERLYYNHRGRSEGKVLGKVVMEKLPSVVPKFNLEASVEELNRLTIEANNAELVVGVRLESFRRAEKLLAVIEVAVNELEGVSLTGLDQFKWSLGQIKEVLKVE